MSLADSASLWQTGFYGKVPSQGDFVNRRLPQEFVTVWDEWLQAGMAESRQLLGEAWQEAYTGAPVWRFVLTPRWDGPGAWAGVLQPSVDRVGRYFPLTFAARLVEDIDPVRTLLRCAPWHDGIERIAEAAFDAETSLEDLDRRIEPQRFPPDGTCATGMSEEDTLPIGGRTFRAVSLPIWTGDSSESLQSELYGKYLSMESAGCGWITRGNQNIGPALLVAKSMPSAKQFCSLLVGRWDEFGWELVPRTLPSAPPVVP